MNPVCPAGNAGDTCHQTVTDSCSGATTTCNCVSTAYCSTPTGAPGTCIASARPAPTTPPRPTGSPAPTAARSTTAPARCSPACATTASAPTTTASTPATTPPNGTVVTGATKGVCCTDNAACTATQCNQTVANQCINDAALPTRLRHRLRRHRLLQRHDLHLLQDLRPARAARGRQPSTRPAQPATAFDAGNGHLITCPCTGGLICSSGGVQVSNTGTPAPQGTCCQSTCTSTACNATGTNNTCTGAALRYRVCTIPTRCVASAARASPTPAPTSACWKTFGAEPVGAARHQRRQPLQRQGRLLHADRRRPALVSRLHGMTNSVCVGETNASSEGVCTCQVPLCGVPSGSCQNERQARRLRRHPENCACPGGNGHLPRQRQLLHAAPVQRAIGRRACRWARATTTTAAAAPSASSAARRRAQLRQQ